MEEEYKLEIISYLSFMPWYRIGKDSIEDINKLYEEFVEYNIIQFNKEDVYYKQVAKMEYERANNCLEEKGYNKHFFESKRDDIDGHLYRICTKCGLIRNYYY